MNSWESYLPMHQPGGLWYCRWSCIADAAGFLISIIILCIWNVTRNRWRDCRERIKQKIDGIFEKFASNAKNKTAMRSVVDLEISGEIWSHGRSDVEAQKQLVSIEMTLVPKWGKKKSFVWDYFPIRTRKTTRLNPITTNPWHSEWILTNPSSTVATSKVTRISYTLIHCISSTITTTSMV